LVVSVVLAIIDVLGLILGHRREAAEVDRLSGICGMS